LRGGAIGHVAQVADLVGQLDQLRARADPGRVLDLQALALGLLQFLVVGDFHHHAGDALAELALQLLEAGVGILDGVVQQRRGEHLGVGDSSLAREHLGERDRVVDVGRGLRVLAPLVAVLVRGESQRAEEQREVFFRPVFHACPRRGAENSRRSGYPHPP
jgi:hypothetical protein